MTDKYVGGKEATKILGVHSRTLYQWDEKKWIDTIRTPGNKRLYNVEKYLRENGKVTANVKPTDVDKIDDEGEEKLNISYVRRLGKTERDDKRSVSRSYNDRRHRIRSKFEQTRNKENNKTRNSREDK